jgi:formate-dependent nitrite reductase cytochrome c552 subunit
LLVDAVEPTECTDVRVEMISPANNGIYQAQWRMCTPMGQYFGGKYFSSAIINVSAFCGGVKGCRFPWDNGSKAIAILQILDSIAGTKYCSYVALHKAVITPSQPHHAS